MKIPTNAIAQPLQERITFIEKTIQKLGTCSIRMEKLTPGEIASLREHFSVEQKMGFAKFQPL
ncbi:MAG: hypothetical protein SH857_16265 [Chitinophagales bacterium]|nr:hypothetical protein [Chitinophagales bacterium]